MPAFRSGASSRSGVAQKPAEFICPLGGRQVRRARFFSPRGRWCRATTGTGRAEREKCCQSRSVAVRGCLPPRATAIYRSHVTLSRRMRKKRAPPRPAGNTVRNGILEALLPGTLGTLTVRLRGLKRTTGRGWSPETHDRGGLEAPSVRQASLESQRRPARQVDPGQCEGGTRHGVPGGPTRTAMAPLDALHAPQWRPWGPYTHTQGDPGGSTRTTGRPWRLDTHHRATLET